MQHRGIHVALLTHHSGHDQGSKAAWVREGGHDVMMGVQGWSGKILLDDEIISAGCFTRSTDYC